MPYKYKRPNSPFFYIGFSKKEKRLYNVKSFSTKTKNHIKAENILRQTSAEIKQTDLEKLYTKDEKYIQFSEAFNLYIRERENTGKTLNPKTIESYNLALKYFYRTPGNKFIQDYSREDYHSFAKSMEKLKQNSRSIYAKRIFAIFHFLVIENYLPLNPFKRIAEVSKDTIIKTKQEVDLLIDYSSHTKFYWTVLFQIASAFRIDEVLRVTKSDIDNGIIKVFGKGNKYSSIPIIDDMKKILSKMPMPTNDQDKIFNFSYDSIWRFYKRFRIKTGIDFHSHDLRKYTLSAMANSGVPINYAQEYARHSSINTTMKYYIRNDKIKMSHEINKRLDLFNDVELANKIEIKEKTTIQTSIHKSTNNAKSA